MKYKRCTINHKNGTEGVLDAKKWKVVPWCQGFEIIAQKQHLY
jgi:hypothetical protein